MGDVLPGLLEGERGHVGDGLNELVGVEGQFEDEGQGLVPKVARRTDVRGLQVVSLD